MIMTSAAQLDRHEPESVEGVFGDVAAVGDVEDDEVVAILGDEVHAAVSHTPTTPVIIVKSINFRTLIQFVLNVL